MTIVPHFNSNLTIYSQPDYFLEKNYAGVIEIRTKYVPCTNPEYYLKNIPTKYNKNTSFILSYQNMALYQFQFSSEYT